MAKKKKIKEIPMYQFDRYECWWEDACGSCEWKSIKDAVQDKPSMCFTEGYLIRKDKDSHIFTMSFQADEVGDQMIIPSKNIKKLTYLYTKKFYEKDYKYETYKKQ
jgi:hypothetical protein